jgi:hypothetical protein
MRRRRRHHRSLRRRLRASSTPRMALYLIIGLLVIAGVMSMLTGVQDVVSSVMSLPDGGFHLSEEQRKAVAPR